MKKIELNINQLIKLNEYAKESNEIYIDTIDIQNMVKALNKKVRGLQKFEDLTIDTIQRMVKNNKVETYKKKNKHLCCPYYEFTKICQHNNYNLYLLKYDNENCNGKIYEYYYA